MFVIFGVAYISARALEFFSTKNWLVSCLCNANFKNQANTWPIKASLVNIANKKALPFKICELAICRASHSQFAFSPHRSIFTMPVLLMCIVIIFFNGYYFSNFTAYALSQIITAKPHSFFLSLLISRNALM